MASNQSALYPIQSLYPILMEVVLWSNWGYSQVRTIVCDVVEDTIWLTGVRACVHICMGASACM